MNMVGIAQLPKNKVDRIFGFFVAKGLLIDPTAIPQPNVKLHVDDVLWVGCNIEPRVIEVFPAALIHFPRTFLGQQNLPAKLVGIINSIKRGEKNGEDYMGLKYKDMKFWSDFKLPDRRTKPVSMKKIMKSFRFSPHIIERLQSKSRKIGVTETEFIENLIEKQVD